MKLIPTLVNSDELELSFHTSGVIQGTSSSCALFVATLDPIFDLPLHPTTRLIVYADDVACLAPRGTAEERARLEPCWWTGH